MNWSLLQADGIPTKDDSDTGRGWNKIVQGQIICFYYYRLLPGVAREKKSKFEANRPRGFWVMLGHTNKQTEITTLYITSLGTQRNQGYS